jgi:hypothetical protein
MTLESTQPLTEMSTRSLPGDKGRPGHKADSLTVICELIRTCGSLDVSQSYGHPRPVTEITLPFICFTKQRTAQLLISEQSRFSYVIRAILRLTIILYIFRLLVVFIYAFTFLFVIKIIITCIMLLTLMGLLLYN